MVRSSALSAVTLLHDPMLLEFDWSLCRVFLALLRRGSMSAAARELGQSHPTIRRQLERLEAELGSPLFTRSSDGVRPTPLAMRLLPVAEEMEASAGRFSRLAASEHRSGVVRIAAEGVLGTRLLPLALDGLLTRHPDVRFHHVSTKGAPNLLRREADLALSWRRPSQESVVATRIGDLTLALFASSAWMRRLGPSSTLEEALTGGTMVGGQAEAALLAGVGEARSRLDEAFALYSDDEDFCLGAAEASLGMVLMPVVLGRSMQTLQRVFPDRTFRREAWAAVHPDLRRVPEVRVVIEALRSVAREA